MINRSYKIVIGLAIALGAFASCSDKKASNIDATLMEDISLMPSMEGENIYTLMSDSGKLTYRMEAPKLAIYDQVDTPYWDFPEGLHITTYTKDGEPEATIKSKFAIYHVQDDLWELRQEVRAKAPGGERIETELLYWDQKKELIYTNVYLEVHDDGLITKGYGFESDQNFDNWEFDDYEIDYISN